MSEGERDRLAVNTLQESGPITRQVRERDRHATSAAQRAKIISSARCASLAMVKPSGSSCGTTPSRMTVRTCSG